MTLEQVSVASPEFHRILLICALLYATPKTYQMWCATRLFALRVPDLRQQYSQRKATGKSKTTIQRAIAKGLISAEKLDGGGYSIDPSELHRVYPRIGHETVSKDSQVDTTRPSDATLELRAKIEGFEALLAREREAISELKTERDAWKQQATALLQGPIKRSSRWPWRRAK